MGDENFVIEVGVAPKDRRPSTSEVFTIVKSEPYLRVYEELASCFSPRSILELGIFQGGSYVFLDKLSKPRRMSAVDIRPKPVEPLLEYVSRTENRFVHFATSQRNGEMLREIVRSEVVTDESKLYLPSIRFRRATAHPKTTSAPGRQTRESSF